MFQYLFLVRVMSVVDYQYRRKIKKWCIHKMKSCTVIKIEGPLYILIQKEVHSILLNKFKKS